MALVLELILFEQSLKFLLVSVAKTTTEHFEHLVVVPVADFVADSASLVLGQPSVPPRRLNLAIQQFPIQVPNTLRLIGRRVHALERKIANLIAIILGDLVGPSIVGVPNKIASLFPMLANLTERSSGYRNGKESCYELHTSKRRVDLKRVLPTVTKFFPCR